MYRPSSARRVVHTTRILATDSCARPVWLDASALRSPLVLLRDRRVRQRLPFARQQHKCCLWVAERRADPEIGFRRRLLLILPADQRSLELRMQRDCVSAVAFCGVEVDQVVDEVDIPPAEEAERFRARGRVVEQVRLRPTAW